MNGCENEFAVLWREREREKISGKGYSNQIYFLYFSRFPERKRDRERRDLDEIISKVPTRLSKAKGEKSKKAEDQAVSPIAKSLIAIRRRRWHRELRSSAGEFSNGNNNSRGNGGAVRGT